jgi:hypothetical protein
MYRYFSVCKPNQEHCRLCELAACLKLKGMMNMLSFLYLLGGIHIRHGVWISLLWIPSFYLQRNEVKTVELFTNVFVFSQKDLHGRK